MSTHTQPNGPRDRPAGDASAPTTVAIVAPTRLCRDGLARALTETEGLVVVAALSDRADDLTRLANVDCRVVIVDAAAKLNATLPALRAVAAGSQLVAFGLATDDDVLACARARVSGYLDRSAGIDELIAAIARVVFGELVCPASIAGVLMRHVGVSHAPPGPVRRLTPRELEILPLLDEGLSNKQIAGRLQIELATVKNHVHNILDKLDVRQRSQAAQKRRESDVNHAVSAELASRGTTVSGRSI